MAGKQQLVGSVTVKSINAYVKDLSQMKEKYKSCWFFWFIRLFG
jgi:hypothetical protein